MHGLRRWGAVLALLAITASVAFGQGVTRNKYLAGTPWAPAINDTVTNCGAITFVLPNAQKWCAESTAVFQTNGYKEILVFMRVLGAEGDTTNIAQVGVTFKATGLDTGRVLPPDSMAAVYQRGGVPDSSNTWIPTTAPPAGTGAYRLPGEVVFNVVPWLASLKSNYYFYPRTLCFPLSAVAGPIWSAGRGQIRVRLISYVNATLAKKPRIQLWVEGVQ